MTAILVVVHEAGRFAAARRRLRSRSDKLIQTSIWPMSKCLSQHISEQQRAIMTVIRNILASSALLLASTMALAETITTSIGTLVTPEGLKILDRDEKPDSKTGKPGGLIVFTKDNDLPRAVFVMNWVFVEPGSKPNDPLDAAVKIGNPFDKSLTSQDAKPVKIGGIDGGRYDGLLPNGLRAVSYVVNNGPFRLIVLLKGPASSPYKDLTNDFGRAIENFTWKLPELSQP